MKILFYGTKNYDEEFFEKLLPSYPGITIKFTEANGEFFKDPYTLVGYDDVRSDHWFYNAVRYCTAKSIIHEKRDNSFYPDAALTRAEFCSCIWNFIQEICNSNDMLSANHVKMPF